ncbi:hypothetical protein [Paenibacillus sp. URB8-2]|uniref:hypothetical protein n=1 Tax=Paenibacillus sp. URB8-2 TaxID=2741301 RepID=UPI0015BA3051|nr:hypothetical protein [Paenibacillus sp. URB8-2]BCG58528.1 hypothetical protein PUR_19530 [Paenibacillus sp. URB8-2]
MNVTIRQFGSFASILSGLLLFAAHLTEEISSSDILIVFAKNLVLVAHLTMVFALISVYETHTRTRRLGMLGLLFSTFGTMFVSAIVLVEIAGVSNTSAAAIQKASEIQWIVTSGPLLFVFGILILGVQLIKSGTRTKQAGILLILGTIVFAAAGYTSGAASIFVIAGSGLTSAGFILLGKPLRQGKPAAGRQITRVM